MITLSLTDEHGPIVLELQRVEVVSDGFHVTRASDGASEEAPAAAHYRGIVRGEEGSVAAISVFDGYVMGLVSDADGQRILGLTATGDAEPQTLVVISNVPAVLRNPATPSTR